MSHLPRSVRILLAAVAATVSIAAAAPPSHAVAPQPSSAPPKIPAAWLEQRVMVTYQSLPRAYTCDALWYKIRDVLRAVGTWNTLWITPYDCKPDTHLDGRSPQLEIRLFALRALSADNARWADTYASPARITLEPGHPQSLAPEDCALLKQTSERLLALIPSVHAVGRPLECRARARAGSFRLTVESLEPLAGSGRTAH